MPIYEYCCSQCGHVFEEIRSMDDRDKEAICPQCHSTLVDKVPSLFSVGGTSSGNVCSLPSSGHG